MFEENILKKKAIFRFDPYIVVEYNNECLTKNVVYLLLVRAYVLYIKCRKIEKFDQTAKRRKVLSPFPFIFPVRIQSMHMRQLIGILSEFSKTVLKFTWYVTSYIYTASC